MTAAVAIKVDTEEDLDGWVRVLQAFEVEEIYELPGLGVPMEGSIMVENTGQIANFHPATIVIVTPIDGDFLKGEESLLGFTHPEEAIYVFGGTITRLTQSDLNGTTSPPPTIYIPLHGDFYPAQAGAIVLWDRYTRGFKRGLPARYS